MEMFWNDSGASLKRFHAQVPTAMKHPTLNTELVALIPHEREVEMCVSIVIASRAESAKRSAASQLYLDQ